MVDNFHELMVHMAKLSKLSAQSMTELGRQNPGLIRDTAMSIRQGLRKWWSLRPPELRDQINDWRSLPRAKPLAEPELLEQESFASIRSCKDACIIYLHHIINPTRIYSEGSEVSVAAEDILDIARKTPEGYGLEMGLLWGMFMAGVAIFNDTEAEALIRRKLSSDASISIYHADRGLELLEILWERQHRLNLKLDWRELQNEMGVQVLALTYVSNISTFLDSGRWTFGTMSPSVEISIPNTTVSGGDSKPYTVYNISLRFQLRSFTVQKRYSDFLTLHSSLSDQVGTAPPATLPAKSWFSKSVSNPELTEERRRALEVYLQTINTIEDSRWRTASAWRAFLNLPTSLTNTTSSKAGALHSVISGPGGGGAPITDAVVWLDCHRELKTQLQDARLNLTNRDQASTPQKQHEASAAAKSSLVKAGGMIAALEEGLTNIQKANEGDSGGWGGQKLGDGEMRRRKDLIATAKKDKEGLENLLTAMVTKSKLDTAVASFQDTQNLMGTPSGRPKAGGRVLGKETAETRELDNQGVVQLQKQKMAEQDLDVEELRKIVHRQKELGIAINQELEVQNDMLRMVDEDVDRVQGKINIAKRRIGKIS
ncbi:hypothetical protein LTR84_006304 [Exophiala bonariae]|uniref:t-SNARE coiled-coil homology domain-containing protein n=1 Tax=Exophiala bonariae TaxID=1690606 RepID=A0AAV9N0U5_9EURO|nr:hypothetical protein LTR84_006304 [Exophiala bonariae]